MKIKLLKSKKDHQQALKEIERLFAAKPDTPEFDKLGVLTLLVEDYEQKHFPIFPPDPVSAILYFMESRGLTRKDLELYIGSRNRVSEILNHKRELSLNMIRNLHDGLKIPYEMLLQKPKHKKLESHRKN